MIILIVLPAAALASCKDNPPCRYDVDCDLTKVCRQSKCVANEDFNMKFGGKCFSDSDCARLERCAFGPDAGMGDCMRAAADGGGPQDASARDAAIADASVREDAGEDGGRQDAAGGADETALDAGDGPPAGGITGIKLDPLQAVYQAGEVTIQAKAEVLGSGDLEGLTVKFAVQDRSRLLLSAQDDEKIYRFQLPDGTKEDYLTGVAGIAGIAGDGVSVLYGSAGSRIIKIVEDQGGAVSSENLATFPSGTISRLALFQYGQVLAALTAGGSTTIKVVLPSGASSSYASIPCTVSGVTVSSSGTIYVMCITGWVYRIRPGSPAKKIGDIGDAASQDGLIQAQGVAMDRSDNIFAVNMPGATAGGLYKIVPQGDGATVARVASLPGPQGVAVDDYGFVLAACNDPQSAGSVKRVNPATGLVTEIAAGFNLNDSPAFDGNIVLLADVVSEANAATGADAKAARAFDVRLGGGPHRLTASVADGQGHTFSDMVAFDVQ